jgi:hypothetical protein
MMKLNSILRSLKIPTNTGWKTSVTGIFPVSFGGDSKFLLLLWNGDEDFVVAENKEEALELAKQKTGNQEMTLMVLDKMMMH